VASIGIGAFSGCTGLTKIVLPNERITAISSQLFENCSSLVDLTIPERATTIGLRAFAGCTGLTKIVLSRLTMYIESSVFQQCYNLAEIHCRNMVPALLSSSSFDDINMATCLLYVPKGFKAAYQRANVWRDFANIIEENVTSLPVIPTSDVVIRSAAHGLSIETKEKTPIVIYAVSGQKVHQAYVNGTTNISLNKGVYIVKIKDENRKVIVE
jgi:hypothetical protein